MPDEKDKKNKSIVSSGQQSITKYSSDLIRRGLDSIAKIEQKDKSVIPYRRKITLENARQVKQVAQLELDYRIDDIKFSPDGKLLAVSTESRVYLYDANNFNMVHIFEADTWGYNFDHTIAFSPDGTILASTGVNTICLWRVSDGSLLREIDIKYGILILDDCRSNIAFSPDGTVLATSVIMFPDVTDSKFCDHFEMHFEIHFYRVTDGSIILDRVTNNIRARCVKTFPKFEESSSYVDSIAFSPDGTILAFSPYFDAFPAPKCNYGVWLWSFPDGYFLRELKGRRGKGIECVTFNSDGTILAGVDTYYRDNDIIRIICLWRVSDGFLLHKLSPEMSVDDDFIRGITLNPDGTILASIADNGITLWGITFNGFFLCDFGLEENDGCAIVFNPDGTILASGDCNSVIRFWGL